MERTKFGKPFRDIEGIYATLYNMAKYIPTCEALEEYYEKDVLSPSYKEYWGNLTVEMTTLAKERLNHWLATENPQTVLNVIKPLHKVGKLTPFLKSLRALAEPKYKFYFETDYCAMPRDFAAPSPFLVFSKNDVTFPTSKRTIKRTRGNTTIEIAGFLLKAEDGQLLYALVKLMWERMIKVDEFGILFVTTLKEIGKSLQKVNPRDADTQESIKNGLIRLRSCVIIISNNEIKGRWHIGGILTSATNIDDTELRIVLDREFINLLGLGYVDLIPDIYLKLPPSEANLYKYLQRQESFKKSKKLFQPINNRKLFEQAGLGGMYPELKTDKYVKDRLRTYLTGLQRRGIVERFTVGTKLTWIGIDPPAPKISRTKMPKAKLKPSFKCPHGFIGGVDFEKYDECETCQLYDTCADAN